MLGLCIVANLQFQVVSSFVGLHSKGVVRWWEILGAQIDKVKNVFYIDLYGWYEI